MHEFVFFSVAVIPPDPLSGGVIPQNPREHPSNFNISAVKKSKETVQNSTYTPPNFLLYTPSPQTKFPGEIPDYYALITAIIERGMKPEYLFLCLRN